MYVCTHTCLCIHTYICTYHTHTHTDNGTGAATSTGAAADAAAYADADADADAECTDGRASSSINHGGATPYFLLGASMGGCLATVASLKHVGAEQSM